MPAPVLCQVWGGNSPHVARVVRASTIEVLDEQAAKRAGLLLAEAHRTDVVDATVVAGAIARNDAIVTSDPSDINHLLSCSPAALEEQRDGRHVLVFAV